MLLEYAARHLFPAVVTCHRYHIITLLNGHSSATVAFAMRLQGMMGPYAKYGLVGAGAGLLFYAFGAQKGGPVSMPGSSCKLYMSSPCLLDQLCHN